MASYSAFSFLLQVLNPKTDLYRLILMIFSAGIGGAMAAYFSPRPGSIPCLVVGLLMTLQFYDPMFGPGLIKVLPVHSATVVVGILASFFGHCFTRRPRISQWAAFRELLKL